MCRKRCCLWRTGNEPDLKYWLENMLVYQRFSVEEVQAATGLTSAEIAAAADKFQIRPGSPPRRAADAKLLTLPYPGGRHPRIGFLDYAPGQTARLQ
ncbi:MAG: hypothetical protein JSS02_15870, partial [Planctomycetes bacterium]|nr:hypothetical protein [Planctomycetota bacterium]